MKKSTQTIILAFASMLITLSAHSNNDEKLTQKIDSLVALQHSEGEPGGVIGILSNSKVVMAKGYGLMNIDHNQPNDKNTTFDIASVAKQFTAFAILLLEGEGKLELDKDIRIYLPNLPKYEYTITIRHLLQHTSGIASTDVVRLLAGISFDELWSQQKEIELIGQYSQLNFKPNTQHVYSNAGYALLAQIIEVVSGLNFPIYLQKMVFNPLGMESALVYSDPNVMLANNSIGYKMTEKKPVKVSSTLDYSYGGSNIYANLNDMIRWGQNFMMPKVGDAHTINRILNTYNTLENGDSINYTYGFNVRKYKGVKMVEHSGGVPGFRNQFMIFPEEDLIIILMFNNESINTRRLANGIADILLANKIIEEQPKPRVEVEINFEKVQKFAGSYQMGDGMELSFMVENDTFWLVLPDESKFQLFAEDDYNYFLKAFNAQCTFGNITNGNVNEMEWHQGGSSYKAKRGEGKIPLTLEEIARFAGKYYQKELKVEYPIIFENGKLVMSTPQTFKKFLGFDSVILSHINGDKFLTDKLGVLEFTRDKDNSVNGFVLLDIGRLQNIKFAIVSK
jgi:CubicO group peptidase (beta-lactamase class C family)